MGSVWSGSCRRQRAGTTDQQTYDSGAKERGEEQEEERAEEEGEGSRSDSIVSGRDDKTGSGRISGRFRRFRAVVIVCSKATLVTVI